MATGSNEEPEWESTMWDSYNFLMKCPDIERLRKMIARYELFKMSLDVPGDIVECGVFKGTGFMQFLKMRQIFIPGSIKKLVGFDIFDKQPELEGNDEVQMSTLFQDSNFTGVKVEDLYKEAEKIAGSRKDVELIAGDVCKTCQEYAESRPGFRISFLHMDLDVAVPTYHALKALWPYVVKGGIVVLDEYAIARWSESKGVDDFFKDIPGVKIQTLRWSKTPTAYIIKE